MTDTPEHPDLSTLVRGELGNAEALDAGAHLESCESCRAELADTVVGHALLTRTSHTLDPERSTTPINLSGKHVATHQPPLAPLAAPPRLNHPRRPVLIGLAAGVAAAAVVGTALGLTQPWADDAADPAPVVAPPEGPPEPPVTVASATLSAVDDGGEPAAGPERGTVTMTDGDGKTRMLIETSGLPSLGDDQFYYAWLLDPDTNKMLPLGQVATSGALAFDLDPRLISSYSAVDVSLEDDDGDPEHSPVSVLRGGYNAATDPGRSPAPSEGNNS